MILQTSSLCRTASGVVGLALGCPGCGRPASLGCGRMQMALAHLSPRPGPRLLSPPGGYPEPWSSPGTQPRLARVSGALCLSQALILQTVLTAGRGPECWGPAASGKPVGMFSIKCFLGVGWQKNSSSGVHLFSALLRGTK